MSVVFPESKLQITLLFCIFLSFESVVFPLSDCLFVIDDFAVVSKYILRDILLFTRSLP